MLARINYIPQTRLFTETFGGLHTAERAADGEFTDILNFTSDDYPVLSTRRKRKKAYPIGSSAFPVYAAVFDDELGVVMVREDKTSDDPLDDGHKPMLFINDYRINQGKDIGLNAEITGRRSIVRMGAYIIIFPDGVYYNTVDEEDYGQLGNTTTGRSTEKFTAEEINRVIGYGVTYLQGIHYGLFAAYSHSTGMGDSYPANPEENDFFFLNGEDGYTLMRYNGGGWRAMEYTKYTICDGEGNELYPSSVGTTAPENPSDGALFFNTGDGVLERWYSEESAWMPVTYYIKLSAPGIGAGFKAGDWFYFEPVGTGGLVPSEASIAGQNKGNHEIIQCTDDFIVFSGVTKRPEVILYEFADLVGRALFVRAERKLPDMDYVVECQNRLWGCKYGDVDGKKINEIYCCKLGDFRSWRTYAGISTDAAAISVGVPGEFTGAVTLGNNPIFFKKNSMLQIYVSATGHHQLSTVSIDGVQPGAAESLVIINNLLYYRGNRGFYVYDGSYPVKISEALPPDIEFRTVRASAAKDKYYAACEADDDTHKWFIYVYDVRKGIWHKERICEDYSTPQGGAPDTIGVEAMFNNPERTDCFVINSIYAIVSVNGGNIPFEGSFIGGDTESRISFEAVLPVFGYSYPDNKSLSRFDFRVKMGAGATVNVFIQYDGEGEWHSAGSFTATAEKKDTFILPVIPRRCDTLQIKLTGSGDVKIYSFARVLETGSDVR